MTTSLRSLIDRLHDGQFDARLRQMRADGLSYRQIADTLGAAGYDVSHETVRQWCLELEQPPIVPVSDDLLPQRDAS